MNRLVFFRLIVALFAGLLAQSLVAQTTTDYQPASALQSGATDNYTPDPTDVVQTQGDAELPTTYVPSLDGTGLIALNSKVRTRMLVGATYSGGWDTNPNSLGTGVASGAFVFSPYIGAQINSSHVLYLFQYQPTIRTYTSDQYSKGTMNMCSAKIVGDISERWHWGFDASGSHGEDSIRLLAPGQTEAVGNIPGAAQGTSSYFPDAGIVTYVNVGAGMHHDISQRDIIEFNASDSYSNYSGLNQTNSIATVSLNYQHFLSQTLSLNVYDQTSYYYGAFHCDSFGLGAGINWKVRENTFVSVAAGPQIDAAGCGKQQGFAYKAAFGTKISAKSQVYVSSDRQMTTAYLGPGLWQEDVSAGYQRELAPARVIAFDIGYVRSSALIATNSYHNTYFDGSYSHRIGHAFSASLSYRNYAGNWGQTNFTRRVAMLSLTWTPGAGHLFQQ